MLRERERGLMLYYSEGRGGLSDSPSDSRLPYLVVRSVHRLITVEGEVDR